MWFSLRYSNVSNFITFSRVPIYHRLYLQGFLDLQDILDTPNGPGSETLENEVYVEYQPSEAYQMLAQSASIIKVICTNRVLNLTCLVRKDLKNSKSPRTRFLLSKKPKIIEIEREHQKIGDVKRYRRTGGGSPRIAIHSYIPTSFGESPVYKTWNLYHFRCCSKRRADLDVPKKHSEAV